MAKRVEKVTYTVTHDAKAGRWSVARNGAATGGFASQMATAIGLAYREASLEQARSEADVTVWSINVAGKRTKNGRPIETKKPATAFAGRGGAPDFLTSGMANPHLPANLGWAYIGLSCEQGACTRRRSRHCHPFGSRNACRSLGRRTYRSGPVLCLERIPDYVDLAAGVSPPRFNSPGLFLHTPPCASLPQCCQWCCS